MACQRLVSFDDVTGSYAYQSVPVSDSECGVSDSLERVVLDAQAYTELASAQANTEALSSLFVEYFGFHQATFTDLSVWLLTTFISCVATGVCFKYMTSY